VFSGAADVDEIGDRLHVPIEREGFETVGGFLLSHLGHVPVDRRDVRYRRASRRSDRSPNGAACARCASAACRRTEDSEKEEIGHARE
jgi:hypothetical protein